ncbi:MAG: hypothetical protein HYT11_03790 [Candidatus Levybacteria bacterium]|nr:hypothetical protein [Candidatus Levybacteria bacterium]
MASLSGSFERGVEQIAQGAKKSMKQQATAIVQAGKSQFIPQKSDIEAGEEGVAGSQSGSSYSDQAQALEQAAVSNAATHQQKQGLSIGQKKPSPFYQRQIAKGKTPQEAANLDKIRKELHEQYFEKLINPPKTKEAASKAVEKKKEEMIETEDNKEKEKLPPLPVQRKQRRIESLPGSG